MAEEMRGHPDTQSQVMARGENTSNFTFLRGQAGIYALGAVAAKFRNDPTRRDFFLQHFNRVSGSSPPALPMSSSSATMFVNHSCIPTWMTICWT